MHSRCRLWPKDKENSVVFSGGAQSGGPLHFLYPLNSRCFVCIDDVDLTQKLILELILNSSLCEIVQEHLHTSPSRVKTDRFAGGPAVLRNFGEEEVARCCTVRRSAWGWRRLVQGLVSLSCERSSETWFLLIITGTPYTGGEGGALVEGEDGRR